MTDIREETTQQNRKSEITEYEGEKGLTTRAIFCTHVQICICDQKMA